MIVQASSVPELEAAPNFAALLGAYVDEEGLPGLPRYMPDMDIYRRLETAGLLHAFEARDEDGLIGFITIITTVTPTTGRLTAAVESFFVTEAKRTSGAGLRLLRRAEAKARELGAVLTASASAGSRLAELLLRLGFVESNVVYYKSFSDNSRIPGGFHGGL